MAIGSNPGSNSQKSSNAGNGSNNNNNNGTGNSSNNGTGNGSNNGTGNSSNNGTGNSSNNNNSNSSSDYGFGNNINMSDSAPASAAAAAAAAPASAAAAAAAAAAAPASAPASASAAPASTPASAPASASASDLSSFEMVNIPNKNSKKISNYRLYCENLKRNYDDKHNEVLILFKFLKTFAKKINELNEENSSMTSDSHNKIKEAINRLPNNDELQELRNELNNAIVVQENIMARSIRAQKQINTRISEFNNNSVSVTPPSSPSSDNTLPTSPSTSQVQAQGYGLKKRKSNKKAKKSKKPKKEKKTKVSGLKKKTKNNNTKRRRVKLVRV